MPPSGQLMSAKLVSRQNLIVILGAVMIVCLALTIVTGAVALIWIGQPLGNAGGIMAGAFTSVFFPSFFLAFALAMAGHQSRNNESHAEKAEKDTKHP
jgi:hypothetical protein